MEKSTKDHLFTSSLKTGLFMGSTSSIIQTSTEQNRLSVSLSIKAVLNSTVQTSRGTVLLHTAYS